MAEKTKGHENSNVREPCHHNPSTSLRLALVGPLLPLPSVHETLFIPTQFVRTIYRG